MVDLDDIDSLHDINFHAIGPWGGPINLGVWCSCGWSFSERYTTPAEFDAAMVRARDEHNQARRGA